MNDFFTENVNVFYGSKQAVKNISIRFPEAQITSLIGPSGCGKSTFLRCLNRMNDFIPNCRVTGRISLGDIDIMSPRVDPVLLRRRVGMVFQKPNPFPKSIYQNVAWGPTKAGVPSIEVDERVESSLRRSALWDEVKDRLHEPGLSLSGGQQQRLCLARALAMNPQVLLMDEPCSALDPIATSKIEQLMADLKKDFTIVIVTHNMQQAARVSDRTAFFLQGELIEIGQTKEFFTRPKNESTENYLTGKFG